MKVKRERGPEQSLMRHYFEKAKGWLKVAIFIGAGTKRPYIKNSKG